MTLHQELTRFDIKCHILRKKAGRSIRILDDKYYEWTFDMIMQKILKCSLRNRLQCGKLGGYFSTEFQTLMT